MERLTTHQDILNIKKENELIRQRLLLSTEESKRMSQETDRKFHEIEKIFEKSDKKFKQLRHLFTGHWGKLVESLVRGDLVRLLRERGILITKTSQRIEGIYDVNNKTVEIDLLAENGDDIVAVEVKTTLKVEDVNTFIENLRIFKSVFPIYKDKNLFGAIAYINVEEKADKYAYRNGLFVIRATGKSASIINDSKFEAKKF